MKNTIFLYLIITSIFSHSQTFEVEAIWQSGSIDNRVNFVILADGYKSNELVKFINDAHRITNTLFNERPFKQYKNFFNVFAIKVPSNESGASHPGTATDVSEPIHPIVEVDNYFGSSFDNSGTHRALFPKKNSKITPVLAKNFPQYDEIIMLVNTPHYGGTGGRFATVSTKTSSSKIIAHELGHTFARLADEYYPGNSSAREAINMTKEKNPDKVQWKNWISKHSFRGIGVYQHCCGGNSSNWYRPHQNCIMRSLNNSFCYVCCEGIVKEIHNLINPIDTHTPSNNQNLSLESETTFSVNLIEPNPNTLKIEWRLNGTIINNENKSVSILPNDLINGDNELLVTVNDDSPFLRLDNHETIHFSTVTWNINSSTLTVDNVTNNNFKIELFPNPTQGILYFNQNTSENYDLTITDATGKKVIKKSFTNTNANQKISLKSLAAGIYFAEFRFENGVMVSRKIIVTK